MGIVNDLKIIFSSQGASDAARDADRVGRSQTRLGNSATNAGRQFAAQSAGLGGLVAAYAGAAATAFALEAAFSGLAKAARSMQTLEGLTAIAAQTAQDGQRIVQSVREITNAQMTLVESAELVNLSLSAGFNTAQIEGLADVALRASRALGRDLTDAYTRVIRGSAKLETELLDELGIYTKIAPATRAYAAATGQAVSDLSEFERRQAFVNSVIAEGLRKYSAISTTVPTASEKIEAFGTKILDLATQVGSFLARVVAPIAEFFTENFGASWGALAAAGFLVLRKGVQELSSTLSNSIANIEAKVASVRDRLGSINEQAQVSGQAAARSVNLASAGLGGGLRKEVKDLRDLARSRALSNAELGRMNSLLQTRATRLTASRQAILQQIVTLRQQRAALRNSGQSVAQVNAALAVQARRLQNNRSVINANTASMNALTAATTKTTSAFAALAAAGYSSMLKLGAAVAAVGLKFLSFGGIILGAVSLVGIFGTAIASLSGTTDEWGAYLQQLQATIASLFNSVENRRRSTVNLGLANAALQEAEAADSALAQVEEFTFTTKYLGIEIEITKTKEDIVREVSSILDGATREYAGFTDALISGPGMAGAIEGAISGAVMGGVVGSGAGGIGAIPGAIGGAVVGAVIGGITSAFNALDDEVQVPENVINRFRNQFSDALSGVGDGAATEIASMLAILEQTSSAARSLDPAARAVYRLQQQLLIDSALQLDNVEAISRIIQATGADAAQVSQQYTFQEGVSDSAVIRDNLRNAQLPIGNYRTAIDILDTSAEEIRSIIENPIVIPAGSISGTILSVRRELNSLQLAGSELPNNVEQYLTNFTDRNLTLIQDINTVLSGAYAEGADLIDEAQYNAFIAATTATGVSMAGLSGSVVSISSEFNNLNTSIEQAQNTLFAIQGVLFSTQEGLNNNTISLEQFSQNIVSSTDALARQVPEILAAQDALAVLDERLAQASARGAEDLGAIQDLRDQQAAIVDQLFEQFALNNRILDAQRAQEDTLRDRIALTEYLNELTEDAANIYQVVGNISTAAGGSTEDYLTGLIEQNTQDIERFSRYREAVQGLEIPEAARQALLSTGMEDFEQLQAVLAEYGITMERILGNTNDVILVGETINKQTGERLELERRVALVSNNTIAANARAEEVEQALLSITQARADEVATFLASYQDILSVLDQQVSISEQELDIARAQASAAATALEHYEDQLELQRDITELERDVSATEARVELAGLLNDSIQNEYDYLIRTRELNQRIAEEENDRLIARIESAQELYDTYVDISNLISNIQSISQGASEADLAGAEVEARLEAISRQYNNEVAVLRAQEQADRERIEAEQGLALARTMAAIDERNMLRDTLADRLAIVRQEQELANLNRRNDLLALQERRDAAESDLTILEKTTALEQTQLNARIDADRERAMAEARNLQNYFSVVEGQDTVQTNFVNRFGTIVTMLGTIMGETPEGLTGFDTSDFGAIGTQVANAVSSIDAVYDQLRNNAVEASELAATASRERLEAEIESLDAQIAAQRMYNVEAALLGSERVRAQQALIMSELELANAGVREAQAAASALSTELDGLASEYAERGMQAQANAVRAVAQELNRIAGVVRAQVESFREDVESALDEVSAIADQEILLEMRFELDRQNLQDQIDMARQQFVLDQLQADIELTNAQESSGSIDAITAAERVNELQLQVLAQQENMLALEVEQYAQRRSDERAIIEQETAQRRQALVQDRQNTEARIRAEYAVVDAQIQQGQDFLQGRQTLDSGLITGLTTVFNGLGNGLRDVFASVITSFNTMFAGVEGFSAAGGVDAFTNIDTPELNEDIAGIFTNLRTNLGDSYTAAIRANNRLFTERNAALSREETRTLQLFDLQTRLDTEAFENRATLAERERLIEEENAAARIASAEEAGGAAEEVTDTLRERLLAIYDSIQSNLEDAFMELNDLIFYGEGDFGEILGNLFRSIQTDIFQTTIAEPLSRLITDNLFSAFGFEGGRQGIENARIDPVSGALFVRPVESAFGIQGVIDKSGEYLNQQNQGFLGGLFSQTRSEMSGIFGGGGFLSNLMQSLFGQGGLFAGLLRGLGNLIRSIFGGGAGGSGGLFGGLFSGIFGGGIGKASGGLVHMAQGGLLNASAMQRDRVPTMLEPGEFVIRRAAARNIGVNNLQQMNATGQAGGNVQVNVTNNGTPQEATASPPKFDGEKFVIDIVTRDLANNGPIRRSIRGGAI